MGLFGTTNDNVLEEVESATNENNTDEQWDQIITICDKAGKTSEAAKNYLKAILKRLNNTDPHIALQAVTLLDACIKNSGRVFHIEVASREFETEFNRLMTKAHTKVAKKLRESLKRWAENEFKSDSQLTLIPSLYSKLRSSGLDFSSDMPIKKTTPVSKDPNVVESQEEEEQILKAIELSLKETTGSPRAVVSSNTASSLYPTANLNTTSSNSTPVKEPKKVRALYDFEAAEDNELTFSAGEIIFVIDDSDQNWWKGSNQRGEGLFPSNFVTHDLTVEPEKFLYEKAKKMVQFKESVDKSLDKEPDEIEIDEVKIDRLLHLLHEADPTNPETDTEEMLKLEKEVDRMGPLIDSELERVDRKHAQLTQLSADLVEALGLYHTLMREPAFPPINKVPYRYNDMAQPPPTTSMGYNGPPMSQPPSMPPIPSGTIGPQYMPNMHPHYQGQPMIGMMGPHHPSQMAPPRTPLPPQPHSMPPQNMMPSDDRRPPMNYIPPGMPQNFPPNGTIGSQTMLQNGPPQQPIQHYMPGPNPNNPK